MTFSFTFDRPVLLLLAAAAPAIWALLWLGDRRRLNAFRTFSGCGGLFPPLIRSAARGSRRDAILAASLLALLATALAGPRAGGPSAEATGPASATGVDVVFALDLSRSMLAADGAPTRLDQAREEIRSLLRGLPGQRVGLVAFAGEAASLCPLTRDHEALWALLRELRPEEIPAPGTRLDTAIAAGLAIVEPNSPAARALVLVTDGEHTTGAAQAGRAKAVGVRLFALGVGSPEGAPVPARAGGFTRDAGGAVVLSRLREEPLRRLAADGGGTYARAPGGGELLVHELAQKTHAPPSAGGSLYRWPLTAAVLLLAWRLRGLPAAHLLVTLALAVCPTVAGAESAAEFSARAAKAYGAGRPAEAEAEFLGAQVRDPASATIAYNLGNVRYRLGRLEGALADYRLALLSAPPSLRLKILYNMGSAAYRLGRFAEAEGYFRRALLLSPHDDDARHNQALAAARASTNRPAPTRAPPQPGRKSPQKPPTTAAQRPARPPAEDSTARPPSGRPERAVPVDPEARRRWAETVLDDLKEGPRSPSARTHSAAAGIAMERDW